MEKAKQLAGALGDYVSKMECYRNYLYYKDRLHTQEDWKRRLMQFKRKQFDLETRKAQGIPIEAAEENSLSDDYFDLMLNLDCAGYINSEREVLKVLTEVYDVIGKQVQIDVSFLD